MGIPKKSLMTGNHWRKAWPEGVTDTDESDPPILEEYNEPACRRWGRCPPPSGPTTLPWHEYEPHTLTWEDEN